MYTHIYPVFTQNCLFHLEIIRYFAKFMNKKSFLWVGITITGILTILFLFYHLWYKKTATLPKEKLPELFNTSKAEQYADSLLKKLSLDEKIKQMFILSPAQKTEEVGGYLYSSFTDSVIENKTSLPFFNLIHYPKNEKYIPKPVTMGMIYENIPLQNQTDALLYKMKSKGFNALFVPFSPAEYNYQSQYISPNVLTTVHHLKIFQKQCAEQKILLGLSEFPTAHGIQDSNSIQQILQKEGRIWQELQKYYISAVQISHTDNQNVKPLYYSSFFTKQVMRNLYHYNGLIFTDRLDQNKTPPDYVQLLKNDVDVYVCPHDLKKAIREIKKAVIVRKVSIQSINNKVKRILMAKYFIQQKPQKALTDIYPHATYRNTVANSVCILKNDKNILPLPINEDFSQWSCVSINADTYTPFQQTLTLFTEKTQYLYLPYRLNEEQFEEKLSKSKTNCIVSIHGVLTPEKAKIIEKFCKSHVVVLVHLGSLYTPLDYYKYAQAVVYHPEQDNDVQDIVAQAILGGYDVKGNFEFLLPKSFKLNKYKACILGIGLPEEGGMHLSKYGVYGHLDSVLKKWIRDKIMPGGQIMVAHKGKIVYQKAFGNLMYENTEKIKMSTLYDMASVTKICATTLMCMRAYQENLLKLEDSLKKYIPYMDTAKGTLKNAVIQKLLTHHSGAGIGLPAYTLKFFQEDAPKMKRYFSKNYKEPKEKNKKLNLKKDTAFTIPIAENLYFRTDMWDSILYRISRLDLEKENEYEYSDFNMYLLQQVIEHIYKKPLNEVVEQEFYTKMNLKRTCFLPLKKFAPDDIAPTEKDDLWRKQQIHGYVHDPTAALCGNVCGNAGLFSNAFGITTIGQMLLNYGYYGRHKLLDTPTVELFTLAQPNTFRGLGFNKPPLQRDSINHPWQMSYRCSPKTYGHTGFTGTCLWVDPEHELVFVMLTNRVYPKASNKKLIERGIRQYVQGLFYEALGVEPRPVKEKPLP
jgi:CubicO group peptidase (beta-lactamase class C family)